MHVPLTPLDFKRRAVQLFGTKTGVVDGVRRFTYREFGERVDALACALLARGAQPGDRVACLAFNSAALLEAYFGVLEAACILLPVNIRLKPLEMAYILNDAGVSQVLIDAEFAPAWKETEPELVQRPGVVWIGSDSDAPPVLASAGASSGRPRPLREDADYEDILRASAGQKPPPLEIDENAVAELFYTSGTTGRPKGVMLTHRNLYLHALSILACLHADDSEIHLHTIPLFHVNGWGTPQALTGVGGTHVMLRRFDPSEVLRLIERERVTRFFAVPTMLTMLLNEPSIKSRDLSSLRLINTGGAATPPDMIRRAEEAFGCKVFGGYGLSETSPVVSLAQLKHHLLDEPVEKRRQLKATAGLPVLGVYVAIVDEQNTELPWDGEGRGELVVRSNIVTAGYWGDEDLTRQSMRGGWFHTGDIATIDREGYVSIVDRKKDIIISGGENISSVEIEKALYEHPSVLESAVIGIPDEQWGEVPRALVVLKPESSATEDELLDFCRGKLAAFKVPKCVEFLPELPKGGTGKILKTVLREPYWSDQPKRVH
jgi:fatty-acyl-CoA synthase